MAYGLAEHRHRFAVWAAARAAQRGFTTVRNLRDALQATDIRAVLASPSTFEYSATQFDELHRQWCLSICASLADRGLSKEKGTYGRAAKLVAVYLKAIVMMGDQCDSRFRSQHASAHRSHPTSGPSGVQGDHVFTPGGVAFGQLDAAGSGWLRATSRPASRCDSNGPTLLDDRGILGTIGHGRRCALTSNWIRRPVCPTMSLRRAAHLAR
jgi:hypothetical protein